MTDKEAMKLALEVMQNQGDVSVDEWIAAEKALQEALAEPEEKYKYGTPLLDAMTGKAEQPARQEPVAIYFMRDNHTFKKLSANVSNALVEIEQEFNDGWTYGMLCSKRKGFQSVHASGSAKRLEFFAECKATLEQWLPTSPPPQRKPLTDEEIYDMYNEPRSDAEMLEFARAIEAAHGIKGDA
jgi:hypothetical protein